MGRGRNGPEVGGFGGISLCCRGPSTLGVDGGPMFWLGPQRTFLPLIKTGKGEVDNQNIRGHGASLGFSLKSQNLCLPDLSK